eukprot:684946-Prymnesium_polylepis.1
MQLRATTPPRDAAPAAPPAHSRPKCSMTAAAVPRGRRPRRRRLARRAAQRAVEPRLLHLPSRPP